MSSGDWKIPTAVQPRPQLYGFDIDRTLSAVAALSATVPSDAFTAESLGTERAGNAVLIRDDGLVLTIGYLVTEASSVWLRFNDGAVVPGHVVGIDPESGFGLVQALGRVPAKALTLGRSADASVGDSVIAAGAGGRRQSVAARITSKQQFAGYWEYLLDEAIFTTPAHPHWGGTGLIGPEGELLGIGSLQLQQETGPDKNEHLNMVVPIDLLGSTIDDLLKYGRPQRAPRPWLGVFATEVDGHVAIAGTVARGPGAAAGLQIGDLVQSVGGAKVDDLADFFRKVWALGEAGVAVPLRIHREGRDTDVTVLSVDRYQLLRKPVLH